MFTSFLFVIKIATTAASCHKELCMYRIGAVLGTSSPKSLHERQQLCTRHPIHYAPLSCHVQALEAHCQLIMTCSITEFTIICCSTLVPDQKRPMLRKSKDNEGHKFPEISI